MKLTYNQKHLVKLLQNGLRLYSTIDNNLKLNGANNPHSFKYLKTTACSLIGKGLLRSCFGVSSTDFVLTQEGKDFKTGL